MRFMPEPVVIKCVERETTFKLFDPEWHARNNSLQYFTASIEGVNVSATSRIYAFMSDSIIGFFETIAKQTKGAEVPPQWWSPERALSLTAAWDLLGQVSLVVQLAPDCYCHWQLKTSLVLEAGQLDEIIKQLKRFWTYPGEGQEMV
jgi:uncharacterized protein DUF6228